MNCSNNYKLIFERLLNFKFVAVNTTNKRLDIIHFETSITEHKDYLCFQIVCKYDHDIRTGINLSKQEFRKIVKESMKRGTFLQSNDRSIYADIISKIFEVCIESNILILDILTQGACLVCNDDKPILAARGNYDEPNFNSVFKCYINSTIFDVLNKLSQAELCFSNSKTDYFSVTNIRNLEKDSYEIAFYYNNKVYIFTAQYAHGNFILMRQFRIVSNYYGLEASYHEANSKAIFEEAQLCAASIDLLSLLD